MRAQRLRKTTAASLAWVSGSLRYRGRQPPPMSGTLAQAMSPSGPLPETAASHWAPNVGSTPVSGIFMRRIHADPCSG